MKPGDRIYDLKGKGLGRVDHIYGSRVVYAPEHIDYKLAPDAVALLVGRDKDDCAPEGCGIPRREEVA